jgi:hypothetical protein
MEKPTVKQIEEYMAGLNGTTQKDIYDVVNKPQHYMLFNKETVAFFAGNDKGIEVRDVIEQLVDKIDDKISDKNIPYSSLFSPDYVQLMQYLMRFMDKNGVEDLKKARWYLDKMISAY